MRPEKKRMGNEQIFKRVEQLCGCFATLPFGSYNSGYEATAFGFRPNSRFARTSHIRKTLGDITDRD
jgi:hypothetical protein